MHAISFISTRPQLWDGGHIRQGGAFAARRVHRTEGVDATLLSLAVPLFLFLPEQGGFAARFAECFAVVLAVWQKLALSAVVLA